MVTMETYFCITCTAHVYVALMYTSLHNLHYFLLITYTTSLPKRILLVVDSCAEKRTNCESCLVMSARQMQSHRGSHRCNITGEDSDNGESPRLQYCFSCLSRRECSKLCEIYHDQDCQQQRYRIDRCVYVDR